MEYTELQKKGFEIAKSYTSLPLQNRLDIIAQTFGCKTAHVETRLCTGKWRGTSDILIVLDNGSSLYIGNRRTPEAKKTSTISEYVNDTLAKYNPETVAEAKKLAESALMKREAEDNARAAEYGLKPYKFLNVEINGSADIKTDSHLGWYYVTIAVDNKIFGHLTTNLHYDIARGVIGEKNRHCDYFVAGGLREGDEDYVFDNVGHSTTSRVYKADLSAAALQRAQETLDRRDREYEKAIKAAENSILNNQAVVNTDIHGNSLIVQLLKEHEITVPLMIQGWITGSLNDIYYDEIGDRWNYHYSGWDNTVFSDCLPLLVSAVQTKQQYEEMNQNGKDEPALDSHIEEEHEDDMEI